MYQLDRGMTEFSVTVYGELEKYNEVISRGRARIFYKKGNRNGTYITDEFAELLLSSIPYAPVKGIYDGEDFGDHGTSRSLGRIYGIVPQEPNITWEDHVDEDGVTRTYACVDVLLFTGLYKEANEIIGKAQSMELYNDSIEGEWRIINGTKYFVFTKGCFLGLQALGDSVEPCFEGAGFFSLNDSISTMIQKIEQYNLNLQQKQSVGGKRMKIIDFQLSDDEKRSMIWSLLNPEAETEGIRYWLNDVYDKYCLAYDISENQYYRVYYTKDDETDSVSLGEKVAVWIVDVTESELTALQTIKALNNGTYEKLDETFTNLNTEIEENSAKIEELSGSIATLTSERDNVMAQYTEANTLLNEAKSSLENAQTELATLAEERDNLAEFKKNIELEAKKNVISSYSTLLNQEVLDEYTTNIDNYTVEDLDKELAYALKKSNPNIFTNSDPTPHYVPKPNTQESGIEAILSKYANK